MNRANKNVNIMMAGTMTRKTNQIIWKRITRDITDKKHAGSVVKVNQKSIIDLSGIIRTKMDIAHTN